MVAPKWSIYRLAHDDDAQEAFWVASNNDDIVRTFDSHLAAVEFVAACLDKS